MPENSSSTAEQPQTLQPAPSPAPPIQSQTATTPEFTGLAENESDASTPPAGKGSLRKKLLGKAGQLADKYGLNFRKGRGRPKNCPDCGGPGNDPECEMCGGTGHVAGKGDVPLGDSAPASVAADRVEGDAPSAAVPVGEGGERASGPTGGPPMGNLLSESIIGAVKGAMGGLADAERILARRAGLDGEMVSRIQRAAKPDPDALENFEKSFRLVAEKRGWDLNSAPEAALAINLGRMLAPHGFLIYELVAEIRAKRATEGAQE